MSNSKKKNKDSTIKTTETVSNPQISTGEIVLYQPEGEIKLEVRVENETVWLTIDQMALLFAKSRSTINEHILNAFSEKELEKSQSVRKIGNSDFSTKPTNYYNLDVIISVGYRVKSIQGTHFRRWANQILKDYMLKGYAINQRRIATDLQIADRLQEQKQLIENQETRINNVDNRLSAVEQHIDFFVKATQLPSGGVLAPNTKFDGYVLIADLVKSAKRSIVFIDPFADISVLKFAAMKAEGVSVTIYSARISHQFKEEAALYKKQHPEFDLRTMQIIHDRFLLVDDTVYHFGASFKDMGAEFSAYSVLNFVTPEEVIEKVKEITKGL
ncbi:RhuM family protein [Fibrobacter sp.]|uniref:RhuM family protein n=1 Tax=Fibrobacter sp. TaxID=35828 RepID=UPI00386D009D